MISVIFISQRVYVVCVLTDISFCAVTPIYTVCSSEFLSSSVRWISVKTNICHTTAWQILVLTYIRRTALERNCTHGVNWSRQRYDWRWCVLYMRRIDVTPVSTPARVSVSAVNRCAGAYEVLPANHTRQDLVTRQTGGRWPRRDDYEPG